MLSGVRFRAYPTAAQAAVLRQWLGHQRFIYNSKVRELRYWHRFARSSLALTGQRPLPDQAYSQFISEETAWLRDVPSQILRNGAYRFAQGCARALKGLGGFPTIRKPHGRQSVMITSELFKFSEAIDPATGEVSRALVLGTPKHSLGHLQFHAHSPYALRRARGPSGPAGRCDRERPSARASRRCCARR
jgi:putative transposase